MGGGLSARLPALWRRLGERLAARRPAWARKLWAAAAGKGDAEAAFLLGEAIVNGHGAASHPANAARWYRQAAEDGHVRAQCRMAQLHLGGFTDAVLRDEALFAQAVEPQAPDYAAALPWARAAAATGDAEGQTLLGQILGNGPPELHDAAGSIEAYSAAAAQDFAPARLGYGIALMLRAWGDADWAAATAELEAAAEAGLAAARYLLGLCAEEGLGQARDADTARAHYIAAAEGGVVPAQARLGRMLLETRLRPNDVLNGETWLRRAGRHGDAEAATLVGLLHADDLEAVQWFQMAAESGGMAGAFNYARCLAAGAGVPRNAVEAAHWLGRAAESGLAEAQASLGAAYIDGQGVMRDARRARLWLLRAAKAGHGGAMFTLGVLYTNENASAARRKAGRDWLAQAAHQGHGLAPVLLAQIQ